MSSDVTDFNTFSHSDLRKMVEALNSGDVMSASDPWRRAADTLKQIRTALDTASSTATDSWQGTSSDAFYDKMTKLANSVNNAAAYANDTANTLKMMSEAIDQAKHDMPDEPGFLSQLGNAISDTAQNVMGVQDDSTQVPIKDQKKAEAVAVMQTLATKYRTATPVLKPPPVTYDDPSVPPPDPTPAAALTAFAMGASLGAVGGYVSAPENSRVVARVTDRPQAAPAVAAPRRSVTPTVTPTDSGIKGGVANPAPRPPKSTAIGAEAPGPTEQVRPAASTPTAPVQAPVLGDGTGLDSARVAGTAPVGTTGVAGPALGGGSAPNGGSLPMGYGSGIGRPVALGVPPVAGEPAQPVNRPVGTFAGRGGAAARGGAEAVGEGELFGGGQAATTPRRGFTEGGSGIGVRGRVPAVEAEAAEAAEVETTAEAEHGTGFLPAGTPQASRQKRKEGKRADYLVEDEESWMLEEPVNPDVVE
ncbi:PPE domain-containing protein [Kitasatospora sp. LaBMicrA B282]|uniref:WXG100 family type VII secretion target n=1 Tax=Kitasatospora sp. LaBMicrA B282 TaxID=3420949 RepID=UPI003D106C4E